VKKVYVVTISEHYETSLYGVYDTEDKAIEVVKKLYEEKQWYFNGASYMEMEVISESNT
jgi:hypothetical protein